MIIRYLSPDFFINADGSFSEEWQEAVYERISFYGYDEESLLQQAEIEDR